MKQLEKRYKKNGYDFEEVKREDDIAIYRQTDELSGRFLGFEVFEIIKHPERIMGGNMIEAREATPSNEQWGSKGFTVCSIFEAEKKMKMLLNRKNEGNLAKTSIL